MARLLPSVSLLESITHIEDLPLDDFIRAVETLRQSIITEKLDGANLWVGLDEDGLYTSREGKSSRAGRWRSPGDIPRVAAYNGFRAAHAALEQVEGIISSALQPGDAVELEVLFGRQPNVVVYGAGDRSYISLLRPVGGTPEARFNDLVRALDGKEVRAEALVISSPDGDRLEERDEVHTWKFTRAQPVSVDRVDLTEVNRLLAGLKAFLRRRHEALGMTNAELARLSLNSVPKAQRPAVKAAREQLLAKLMHEFKLPIKDALLNKFVRRLKPRLQADRLHPDEDLGVEGVVARDPVTGGQLKIVDKDLFTTINAFNNSVRNLISGLVRTTDQDAPLELRGGVLGQAKIRIANLLGARELALSSGARRFLSRFKGANVAETVSALANSLNIAHNLPALRTKVVAVLTAALRDIDAQLGDFRVNSGKYKLILKTGKELGLSPEVRARTLTAFAEAKREINDIITAVKKSRRPEELLMALYGQTINSLFTGEAQDMRESSFGLIKSLIENEGGGNGGEGGGVEPQVALPAGTTAGAIAPYPKRLFKDGRMIVRRRRNFSKAKKFIAPEHLRVATPEGQSLLRALINEDGAVKARVATDVDDSVGAKRDIEFTQLRNNIKLGDTVSQVDVSRYLDKAHELNDEVDTVTFGLELDDGAVVKVYVNATQADEFEVALSGLLGQEDDIEKVINLMADKFDVVDVEWPESPFSPVVNEPKEGQLDKAPSGKGPFAETGFDDRAEANGIDIGGEAEVGDEEGKRAAPRVNEENKDEFDLSLSDVDDGQGKDQDEDLEDEDFKDEDQDEDLEDEDFKDEDQDEDFEDQDEDLEDENQDENLEDEDFEDEDFEDEDFEDEDFEDEDFEDEDFEDEDQDEDFEDKVDDFEDLEDDDFKDDDFEGEGEDLIGAAGKNEKDSKQQRGPKMTTFTLGEQFTQRLLAERKAPEQKKSEEELEKDHEEVIRPIAEAMPEDLKELLGSFPRARDKAIVMMMYLLGVPGDVLRLKKVELADNVRAVGDEFAKNSQFRLWVRRLMNRLSGELAAATSTNEALTAVISHLNDLHGRLIYAVLIKLGLPESAERVALRALTDGIRRVADLLKQDKEAFVMLRRVAQLLGIDHREPLTIDALQDLKRAQEVRENLNMVDAATPVNLTDKMFELMAALGINDKEIRAQRQQVLEMRRKLQGIKDKARFGRMLNYLLTAVQAVQEGVQLTEARRGRPPKARGLAANPPEILDDLDDSAVDAEKELRRGITHARRRSAETTPADLGRWYVASLGKSGIMLRNKDLLLRLDLEEAEKLADAIGLAKVVSVLARDGQRYVFRPINRGQSYAVKRANDETFPNGVLITGADLDRVLDVIAES